MIKLPVQLKIKMSNVIDTPFRELVVRGLADLGFRGYAGHYIQDFGDRGAMAEWWMKVQQLYDDTGRIVIKNGPLSAEQFALFYKKIRPELKLEGLLWSKPGKVWYKYTTMPVDKFQRLEGRVLEMFQVLKLPAPDIIFEKMNIEPESTPDEAAPAPEAETTTPTPEVSEPPSDERVKRWLICRRVNFKALEIISTKIKTGFRLYKTREEAEKLTKAGRFLIEVDVRPSGFIKIMADKKKMMADWKKQQIKLQKKLMKTGKYTKKGVIGQLNKLKKKFVAGYKSPETTEAVTMVTGMDVNSIHKQCLTANKTLLLVKIYKLIYTKVKGKYIYLKFFNRIWGGAYNAIPANKISPPNYIKIPKLFVWDVLELMSLEEFGDETITFIAPALKKLKDRLDNYKEIKLELPKMNPARKLDDYQIDGIKFLMTRGSGLIAMSPGTGKTITGLVYVKEMYKQDKIDKAIVICPPAVRMEWLLEIHDWFGMNTLKRVGVVQGTPDERKRIWNNKDTILYICNYELLSRGDARVMEKLCQKYKVMIICDESTKIKNTGKRRTALMQIPAKYRVAMSGTPFENHHVELYNLEQWLGTGIFGTKVDFIGNYVARRSRRQVELDAQLHALLSQKIMYRILLQDVVDMKKLNLQERLVEFPPEAKGDYQKIVKIAEEKAGEWRATKEELDQLKILAIREPEVAKRIAILESKLKQIRGGMFAILNASRLYCAHPILLKLSASGLCNEVYEKLEAPKVAPKYDLLKQILGEVDPGRSMIIFTGYVKMANKLVRKLKHMTDRPIFKLGGPTRMTVEDMLELKQNFSKQPGSILVSTDKGTYGLNLQTANVVINYDSWWNPQRIAQRIGRIYRRGQMKDCDVFMLHIKDEDVVEQSIRAVMGRKAAFAGRVIDGYDPGGYTEALARR